MGIVNIQNLQVSTGRSGSGPTRIYNAGRNHLRPDGKPVIIHWENVTFALPPVGGYVTVNDGATARKIVTNHHGLSLTPPQEVKAPAVVLTPEALTVDTTATAATEVTETEETVAKTTTRKGKGE